MVLGMHVHRRGAKEADEQISELVRIIDAVKGDTNKHMAHEEQEVLPLLEAHLCAAEQRAMVWRTLRAMPLRLLERVMPWVAGTLHLSFPTITPVTGGHPAFHACAKAAASARVCVSVPRVSNLRALGCMPADVDMCASL